MDGFLVFGRVLRRVPVSFSSSGLPSSPSSLVRRGRFQGSKLSSSVVMWGNITVFG